jgi:hypothetical protein
LVITEVWGTHRISKNRWSEATVNLFIYKMAPLTEKLVTNSISTRC